MIREVYVKTPKDAADLCTSYKTKEQEHFLMLTLDTHHKVIRKRCMFKGTTDHAEVCMRDLFRDAVRDNAVAIILLHNHPSGDLVPSNLDRLLTSQVRECGELLAIELLDHIIISRKGYYSFQANSESSILKGHQERKCAATPM